jgi:membrane protease YdiL (CAAX protease family)
MKRIFLGLLWALALIAAGAALGRRFIPLFVVATLPHHAPIWRQGLGAAGGTVLFFSLAGFGWLPGTRPPRGAPVAWGWGQAVWLFVQFFTMQATGAAILLLLFLAVMTAGHFLHFPVPAAAVSGNLILLVTVAGYLTAAFWSLWYISRLGTARWRDGSPLGIGWRPAPARAYLVAILALLIVGVFAVAVQHVLPPSPAAQKTNPFTEIFGTHGWKVAVLFILAAVAAPLTEELVFRGGIFSALAGSCGTVWSGAITTALFTVAHLQESLGYPPGLLIILAVALALIFLRVRYRSIRPGILLHVLFNGSSVVMAALAH